jgi:hypothetical protein
MGHRCGASSYRARRAPPGRAYHPRVSWLALAVAALAFALALIPTRRLFLAGWRPAPLAAYLLVLMALAIGVVLFRAGIRVLVPILLVLYIAPFVGAPEIVARTITRLGAGRGGRGARGIVDAVAGSADARPDDEPPAAAPGRGSRPDDGAAGDDVAPAAGAAPEADGRPAPEPDPPTPAADGRA